MAGILVIDDGRSILSTIRILLERGAATKLGAVSSLQKPFRPGDLLDAVTRSLPVSAASSGAPSGIQGNILPRPT